MTTSPLERNPKRNDLTKKLQESAEEDDCDIVIEMPPASFEGEDQSVAQLNNSKSEEELRKAYNEALITGREHFTLSYVVQCHNLDDLPGDNETDVWAHAFHPREPHIVATVGGRFVCFLDCRTGDAIARYAHPGEEDFYCVAWSILSPQKSSASNCESIILAAAGRFGSIKLFDFDNKTLYAVLRPNALGYATNVVTFSTKHPTWLLAGSEDSNVYLYVVPTPASLASMATTTANKKHQQVIQSTAWQRPVAVFRCHSNAISSLSITPCGTAFVSAGLDGRCLEWSFPNKASLTYGRVVDISHPSTTTASSENENPGYYGNGLRIHGSIVDTVACVSSEVAVSKSAAENEVLVWALENGCHGPRAGRQQSILEAKHNARFAATERILGTLWLPTHGTSESKFEYWFKLSTWRSPSAGSTWVVGGDDRGAVLMYDTAMLVKFDTPFSELVPPRFVLYDRGWNRASSRLRSVGVSPDGRYVVATSQDNRVYIWHALTEGISTWWQRAEKGSVQHRDYLIRSNSEGDARTGMHTTVLLESESSFLKRPLRRTAHSGSAPNTNSTTSSSGESEDDEVQEQEVKETEERTNEMKENESEEEEDEDDVVLQGFDDSDDEETPAPGKDSTVLVAKQRASDSKAKSDSNPKRPSKDNARSNDGSDEDDEDEPEFYMPPSSGSESETETFHITGSTSENDSTDSEQHIYGVALHYDVTPANSQESAKPTASKPKPSSDSELSSDEDTENESPTSVKQRAHTNEANLKSGGIQKIPLRRTVPPRTVK